MPESLPNIILNFDTLTVHTSLRFSKIARFSGQADPRELLIFSLGEIKNNIHPTEILYLLLK